MKNKALKIAAITAVCIVGAGTSVYAASSFIQKYSHDGGNAVIFTDDKNLDKDITDNLGISFENTDDIRECADEEWYDNIYKDEAVGKYSYLDESPSYYSNDGVNWIEDTDAAKSITDRYVYNNLDEAFEKAGIPNILKALETDFKLTSNLANAYEYYTDKDSTILSRSFHSVLENDNKKIIADIDCLLEEEEDNVESTTTMVLNGLDVSDYREVTTSNGATYALQNVNDEGDQHIAANILTGKYTISLKLYNMSEKEIVNVLEKINITSLQ